jgi:hypothetical protein
MYKDAIILFFILLLSFAIVYGLAYFTGFLIPASVIVAGGFLPSNISKEEYFTFKKIIKYCNPPFIVKDVKHPKGFNMKLIDESQLWGGSKQRLLPAFLGNISHKEIVYAGPHGGYAQIALAYCGLMLGLKVTVFVDCNKHQRAPLTDIAKGFNADVHYFTGKGKALQKISITAKKYSDKNKAYLLPFGMKNKYAVSLYAHYFKPLKNLQVKRLWVVVGSGLIMTALHKVFPNAKLLLVQVGKKIWPDQLKGINNTLYVSPYKFYQSMQEIPPYNTLSTYDGKLWPFVLKYGEPGDFIWNTAGNPRKLSDVKVERAAIIEKVTIRNNKANEYVNMYEGDITTAQTLEPVNDMFNNMQEEIKHGKFGQVLLERNTDDTYSLSDGISNHFTETERKKCRFGNGKLPPVEFIKKNKTMILRKSFLHDIHPAKSLYFMRGYGECNNFNPYIMINAAIRYFPDLSKLEVLDPSMGWGDRLIASLAMKVKSYTGFDPNKSLHPHYSKIATTFPTSTVKHIPNKFSRKPLGGKLFNFVFTSPPFYDVEIYEGTEDDVAGTYREWFDKIYKPYLHNMADSLTPDGVLCVYTSNIGKYNLFDETQEVFKAKKLKYVETLYYKNNYYYIDDFEEKGKSRLMMVYKLQK